MNNLKIITCASYCASGSSAVTDLLGEFDDVYFMGDYEFRFVQDPDGLLDLKFNMVDNPHRHNSGYALKKYKKNVDFLSGNALVKKYEPFFSGKFKSISYKYIDELTLFKFKGYWHQDVIDKGYWFYFFERVFKKFIVGTYVKLFYKGYEASVKDPLMRNEITYVPYDNKEYFLKTTRDYLDELFTVANKDNKKFIMVDQLVPPNNCSNYLELFNDLKIIAVDRDPRDLYILEKTMWRGAVIPTYDVHDYCKWIKVTRQHRLYEKDDSTKVLRIYLEDMIYHYDDTKRKIVSFVGLEGCEHMHPFKYFDPSFSINNTRLWLKHPELADDIKIIETELSEFCYNNY